MPYHLLRESHVSMTLAKQYNLILFHMFIHTDEDDNTFEVTEYLKNLTNKDSVQLGGALGLSVPKLKKMNDLPSKTQYFDRQYIDVY